MAKNPALQVVLAEASANGWTCRPGTKHLVLACPCGDHLVTAPTNVSDHRAIHNLTSMFRRCPKWPKQK